jgi:hypothetical protein
MKHYDPESHIAMLALIITFSLAYVLIAKFFEASRETEPTKIERAR